MKAFEINAEPRDARGRAKSRRLRREGKVPAVVYGGSSEPVALTLDHNALKHQLDNEAFYSHIISLKIAGGGTEDVVLRDLQRHPSRPFVQHVDLLRVVAGEVLRMAVPVRFTGEEKAPGVLEEGGILSRNLNEVEVECLPRDLPEYIEVDCSALTLHDAVHLSDLTLPDGVTLIDLSQDEDEDLTVVSVQLPRAAVEEEDEEAADAEAAEGEDTAEGEQASAEGESGEEDAGGDK